MMNNTPFNSHLFLGFDELEDMLCKVARTGDSFPPYNIELVDDNTLEISLAVAGYTEQDLEVSLEDTELVIRGRQDHNEQKRYTHKGIAARSFIKTFILADGMVVENVALTYGLLVITVRKPIKKAKKVVLKITHQPKNTHVIEAKGGPK
ncbi:MAG: Hsp20 family protein [Alphaproteobacteria bacterium]|nr:Hsp20 family protein [Alphaproteobacteria bacterium]MBR6675391.1 Hsp20 family protein [Alphaproteobacteria bacterium]